MKEYILVTIILAIASFVYLKLADKFNIIDKPNHRSSHTQITVRGGGILFALAAVLFSLFNDFQYPYFTIGLIFISIISFVDDIITLSSAIRFPLQILAILLMLYQLDLIFETNFFWVIWLVICATGFINFFNFMDGINGITGLYSISVLFGVYLLNQKIDTINDDLIIYTLISLIIFGFYNFRKKALFFAGDIGSISLALIIIFSVFGLVNASGSPVILLIIMVYGADALLTLIYRKFFLKEKVTEPHRHHLYQILVDKINISHLKVSFIYAVVQFVFVLIALYTYQLEIIKQYVIFVLSMGILTLTYIISYRKIISIMR